VVELRRAGEAHRLQVRHDIEDDEVVQEVEESRNGPLEEAEKVRTAGATELRPRASL